MTIERIIDSFETERLGILELANKGGFGELEKIERGLEDFNIHCEAVNKLSTESIELGERKLIDELECSVEKLKGLQVVTVTRQGEVKSQYLAAQSQKRYLIHEANTLAQRMTIESVNSFDIDRLRGLVLSLNYLDVEVVNVILMTLILHLPPPKISLKSAQYYNVLLQIRFRQDLGECSSFYSACKSYLQFLQSAEKELNILEKELVAKDFNSAHHALKAAKKRMGL